MVAMPPPWGTPDPNTDDLVARAQEVVARLQQLGEVADAARRETARLHDEALSLAAEIARRRKDERLAAASVSGGVFLCAVCRRGIAKFKDMVIVGLGAVHQACATPEQRQAAG